MLAGCSLHQAAAEMMATMATPQYVHAVQQVSCPAKNILALVLLTGCLRSPAFDHELRRVHNECSQIFSLVGFLFPLMHSCAAGSDLLSSLLCIILGPLISVAWRASVSLQLSIVRRSFRVWSCVCVCVCVCASADAGFCGSVCVCVCVGRAVMGICDQMVDEEQKLMQQCQSTADTMQQWEARLVSILIHAHRQRLLVCQHSITPQHPLQTL